MPIIAGQDPNEAYDIGHMPAREHDLPPDWWTVFCNGMPAREHDLPPDWWTVFCNGIPVRHCAPGRLDLAERYATDPDYRLSLVATKLHDRKQIVGDRRS